LFRLVGPFGPACGESLCLHEAGGGYGYWGARESVKLLWRLPRYADPPPRDDNTSIL
jgi:hypothetical protein